MHRHLNDCSYRRSRPEVFLGKDILNICSKFTEEHSYRSAIYTLLPCDGKTANINIKQPSIHTVLNNCCIIDQNNVWSRLSFLEAYYIRTLKPEINDGLKASKELDLFK